MKLIQCALFAFLIFSNSNYKSQNNTKMQAQNNPLLCDPQNGICEIPANSEEETNKISNEKMNKPIKVIYYTDPICSSCWGIEPQLRKLKLEFENIIEIEYRMGGLLPDWSYNSGGISKPSDVAHHWDEVSVYYQMPIDGDVWLEDPLSSSYPPSIAFKAAQMQDNEKAILFLREIREMVFLQKKNITRFDFLELAAKKVGLNIEQFKIDYEGKGKDYFEQDLKLAKEAKVRGFPSIFFINEAGNSEFVYGSKPYSVYESAILKLCPKALKINYDKTWEFIFSKYHSLTLREFSELSETPKHESEEILNELTKSEKLKKLTTKNGSIWELKDTAH